MRPERRASRILGNPCPLKKLAVTPLAGALSLALSFNALAETPSDAGYRGRPRSSTPSRSRASSIKAPSSVKYTEPLLDTPQTITVVTKEVLDEQNLVSLRDALSTLPGITFGAGEGGGGYGDSITLRGFNASSDITTDSVRDSAQYSRTDTFNVDVVELINGANSVYSGAGSVGGNINLVSKAARVGDSTSCRAASARTATAASPPTATTTSTTAWPSA